MRNFKYRISLGICPRYNDEVIVARSNKQLDTWNLFRVSHNGLIPICFYTHITSCDWMNHWWHTRDGHSLVHCHNAWKEWLRINTTRVSDLPLPANMEKIGICPATYMPVYLVRVKSWWGSRYRNECFGNECYIIRDDHHYLKVIEHNWELEELDQESFKWQLSLVCSRDYYGEPLALQLFKRFKLVCPKRLNWLEGF